VLIPGKGRPGAQAHQY